MKWLLAIYFLTNLNQDESARIHSKNKFDCYHSFKSNSHFGQYKRLAISTDSPICAAHGRDILLRNGSIIDAAIATALCNGLVNMHSMGLGGGFIMVYYNASEGKSYVLDAREVAPMNAHKDMFVNSTYTERTLGGRAIAIPGELMGYYAAWQRFGKLPWIELFNRSIEMATNGIPVSPTLEKEIISIGEEFKANSSLRNLLFNSTTKEFKKRGDVIIRENLAKYLLEVSRNAGKMRESNLHSDLAADLRDLGSEIDLEQILDYKPIWRDPIIMEVRKSPEYNTDTDFLMHAAPPPSSGPLIGLALNIMSKFNYSRSQDKQCSNSSLYYHRLLETFKLIFAQRSHLSDISFLQPYAQNLLNNITTLSFADYLQSRITDGHTHEWAYYGSVFSRPSDVGTSHTSMMAENGDALSLTSTLNLRFGSQLLGSRTGILFNNQMVDFASPNASDHFKLPPAAPNFIQPGKRPMSSVCPVIFTHRKNKTVKLVIGASGGSLIITSVIMASLANLHLNMDIKTSIDGPRLHHQLLPNRVTYDSEFSPEILRDLEKYGHIIDHTVRKSSVQGISTDIEGEYASEDQMSGQKIHIYANADYRKGGLDAGI